mmetsp:Transcript_22389/g.46698  ORF Transcript_22389/g.46698 Transcript_22389/m.46698 type:complete len:147 (-) Transcript_22389:244-684(-)
MRQKRCLLLFCRCSKLYPESLARRVLCLAPQEKDEMPHRHSSHTINDKFESGIPTRRPLSSQAFQDSINGIVQVDNQTGRERPVANTPSELENGALLDRQHLGRTPTHSKRNDGKLVHTSWATIRVGFLLAKRGDAFARPSITGIY